MKTSHPKPAIHSDLPSVTIPDFSFVKPIGEGSYGDVWLARSITGAYRAIKIVRREQFDSDSSFDREFRGIQAYEPVSRTHNNLLQILHIGQNTAENFYYYVMELADDESGSPISDPMTYIPKTLHTLIRAENRLPVSDVIQIGQELAAGLSFLHTLNLVHRDIKPSNIVFVQGVAKLGDAGLVSQSRDDMSLVGTIGYIPPEGMGKPQADQFSLGMVLYEASTGNSKQVFPQIPADLPSWKDKAVFLQLNRIVLKACDPNPACRYKTVSSLHSALNRIQNESSGKMEKAIKSFMTHPVHLSVLIAIAIMTGVLFMRHDKNSPDSNTIEAPVTTSPVTIVDNKKNNPDQQTPNLQDPPSPDTSKERDDSTTVIIISDNAGEFLSP